MATELLNAWAEMDLLRAKTLEEMREFPVLLCPVASVPAWRHGEREWEIDGQTVEYLDAVRYTQWFNTLGAPAAVVPVGSFAGGTADRGAGCGRPFEDEVVLGVAGVLDRAFGFRAPGMAARA